MRRKAVDDPVIYKLFSFVHSFHRWKRADEKKKQKLGFSRLFFMERNKYTVDLSVVYLYGLSYFGLRFLLKEKTVNS